LLPVQHQRPSLGHLLPLLPRRRYRWP
jgi:hypothetical protein